MRAKLKQFLDAVEIEFDAARKNYDQTKKAAEEVAVAASLSPSQSGDRYHSQSAADLAKQTFEVVKSLRDELKSDIDKDINVVGAPCFINFDDDQIYLVNYPVLINGFKIISSKSPLGLNLLGKKAGDKVNGKEILRIG